MKCRSWRSCLFPYLTLSQPCSSVQIEHNICKNMNSTCSACLATTWTRPPLESTDEYLIKSFHLSGHTFQFRWTVQDLEVFLVQSNSSLAVKGSRSISKMSSSSSSGAANTIILNHEALLWLSASVSNVWISPMKHAEPVVEIASKANNRWFPSCLSPISKQVLVQSLSYGN